MKRLRISARPDGTRIGWIDYKLNGVSIGSSRPSSLFPGNELIKTAKLELFIRKHNLQATSKPL